jgi:exopolysaccharide production protein ExoQ
MPAQLALLLCLGFVLFLLRLDRKQAPDLSRALWIPTIWVLLVASRPLSAWLSRPVLDAESGNPIDQVFQSGLICVALLLLAMRGLNWSKAIRGNGWLLALLLYMLLTVLWSDIPGTSFRRWVKEFGCVVMAFVMLTEKSPQRAVECILRRTVYILIPFSVLLIKYFPANGVAYGEWTGEVLWIGVTLQKNGIGRLCLIAGFYLIWRFARSWKRPDVRVVKYQTPAEVLVFVMTAWLLKGPSLWAASATGIAALSAGLVAFAGICWMKKRRIQLGVGACAMILAFTIGFGIITPVVGGATVGSFTSVLGRNSTLTGRTDIWAGLLPKVTVLGSGFGSFWTARNKEDHRAGEAHNGYLEVSLSLGIVGLALLVAFLLSSCRKAAAALSSDHYWGSFCICCLIMAAVHNLSESSFDSFMRHLMNIVLFVSVSVPPVLRRAGYSRAAGSHGRSAIPELTGSALRPDFAQDR